MVMPLCYQRLWPMTWLFNLLTYGLPIFNPWTFFADHGALVDKIYAFSVELFIQMHNHLFLYIAGEKEKEQQEFFSVQPETYLHSRAWQEGAPQTIHDGRWGRLVNHSCLQMWHSPIFYSGFCQYCENYMYDVMFGLVSLVQHIEYIFYGVAIFFDYTLTIVMTIFNCLRLSNINDIGVWYDQYFVIDTQPSFNL